jgi:hypothetical protein
MDGRKKEVRMKEKDLKEILLGYTSDMLGVEKHLLEVIKWQVDDDRFKPYKEAHELLKRVQSTLISHTVALEQYISSSGVKSTASVLKRGATKLTGAATGLYNLMRREDPVGRNLRDDYTAMNMVAISYTMLHTTALTDRNPELADLALKHLKEITPLVMELSQVIPSIVVKELSVEGKALDLTAIEQAVANTQEAWRPEAHP